MGVGIDPDDIDVRRKNIAVFDDVSSCARGNVDRLRAELKDRRSPFRRFVGEEQPDRDADRSRRARGHHMCLNDEVGSWQKAPHERVVTFERDFPRRPTQKQTVGKLGFVDDHAVVAGLVVARIELTRASGPVDEDARVVNDVRAPGAKLDGANVSW